MNVPTISSPKKPSSSLDHIPGAEWWVTILARVKNRIAIATLIVLAVFVISITLLTVAVFIPGLQNSLSFILVVVIIGLLLLAFLALWGAPLSESDSETGLGLRASPWAPPKKESEEIAERIRTEGGETVTGYQETNRLSLLTWQSETMQLFPQAILYSTPIYFLDRKLRMVDWNIGFELLFGEIAGNIRGKHVNSFIARLDNYRDVFRVAREFSRGEQQDKVFPFAHKEVLAYRSTRYGRIEVVKIAVQLTDRFGQVRGWAVSLLPVHINWELFEGDMFESVRREKAWAVYSVAYDNVLLNYDKYQALSRDVIAVVSEVPGLVADLGAGTGVATAELLRRGHEVIAVEKNVGMLDRLGHKFAGQDHLAILRGSADQLEYLGDGSVDAVVMMNVLYSVDHPFKCLKEIHRVLRPGGFLGLSTTHEDTDVRPLLDDIREELKAKKLYNKLAEDFEIVRKVNIELQETIVKRYSRSDVDDWLVKAGFEISKRVDSTYMGAVMIRHARKPNQPLAGVVGGSRRYVDVEEEPRGGS